MATSSIPTTLDWLVENIAALPACADITSDGWPTSQGETGIAIGITPDDDATETEVLAAQLGGDLEDEFFDIPCAIWSWAGGTSAKAPRDAAFAIYDAVLTLVRADRSLGGSLHSGWALFPSVVVMQTNTATEAGEGRRCEIRFTIRCRNRF